jgi:hypothetical protein
MTELLKEKEYNLLSDCQYFDKAGQLQSTSKVKMFALKFCDSDSIADLSFYKVLQFLCEKGYIAPIQEGKLKFDSMESRVARILVMEYDKSFLDLSPFLPKE